MADYPGHIISILLPSKDEVINFAEGLVHYLFPVTQNRQAFLQTHDEEKQKLVKQLNNIIASVSNGTALSSGDIGDEYFSGLEEIKNLLIKDAELIVAFDPAASSIDEVILSYPGFFAIMVHRLSHPLHQKNIPIIPRIISEWAHSKTGIDINPGAQIGCPFFIDHGTGVVIGETAIIGNNVKIYQGVTLGAIAVRKEDAEIKRHPTIEDNVVLYSGSTILGGNTVIGHDSIIGGNTWLTQSVAPYSVVYHKNQMVITNRKDIEEGLNFII